MKVVSRKGNVGGLKPRTKVLEFIPKIAPLKKKLAFFTMIFASEEVFEQIHTPAIMILLANGRRFATRIMI